MSVVNQTCESRRSAGFLELGVQFYRRIWGTEVLQCGPGAEPGLEGVWGEAPGS